jgi:hypothetical protein
MNRFVHRISFGDAALADHARLKVEWCAVLVPIVGEPDAAILFSIFESYVRAVARLHLAARICFLSSLGERLDVERLLCGAALRTISLAARDDTTLAAVCGCLPGLTVDRLFSVAIKLQAFAEDAQRRDATP